LEEPPLPPIPDFVFPAHVLAPGAVVVIYCSEKNNPWHAPFKLPEGGCTLRLLNASGAESDAVTLPAQQADISLARLFDGSRTFVSNHSQHRRHELRQRQHQSQNRIQSLDTALLKEGRWRFRAQAWDDSGMFTLMIPGARSPPHPTRAGRRPAL
jgi:hypothetical protein